MDLGFAAERCGELLARHGVVRELVGTVGRQGFVVEPRRWKVEQTFGCLQRYRRLRVDDEMSKETSRHMTVLASLFMTGMRLALLWDVLLRRALDRGCGQGGSDAR